MLSKLLSRLPHDHTDLTAAVQDILDVAPVVLPAAGASHGTPAQRLAACLRLLRVLDLDPQETEIEISEP